MIRSIKKLAYNVLRKQPLASPIEVERAEQTFYINYLRPDMVVFDVGANVGELTFLFSRFIGGGKCIVLSR